MIKLMDLIRLTGVKIGKYKIHCATPIADPTPLEAYYDGRFREWQEFQSKRNFECDQIVSLISLGGSDWLFAGVFKVKGCKEWSRKNSKTWWFPNCEFKYETSAVSGLEDLSGKAIVSFPKKFRACYLIGDRWADALGIKEIRPEKLSIGDFPGFNRVCLSFKSLQIIVRQEIQTWKTALGNTAGVYLIVDVKNGMQYIGSAFGEGGLWQRWRSYAKTGHGGNKELRSLLAKHNLKYADNFLFTILEIIDINADEDYVLSRECHWKNALLTRQFGYNSN